MESCYVPASSCPSGKAKWVKLNHIKPDYYPGRQEGILTRGKKPETQLLSRCCQYRCCQNFKCGETVNKIPLKIILFMLFKISFEKLGQEQIC